MVQSQQQHNFNSREDSYLANIALLYYQEGLNQSEIARRLGLSRATIVNYLREGKERGIIDIRVNGERLRHSQKSRKLAEFYNLDDVYIAHTGKDADPEFSRRHTARVAALAFHNIVAPGDIIGVAWGETIKLVSQHLPNRPIPKTEICQVIGSMESSRLLSAEDCAIKIANQIGAVCHTLHAPAVLSSSDLAAALRNEPTIKKQFSRFQNLNAILTSVGDLSENTHVVSSGIIEKADLDKIISDGAAGFICSYLINHNGDNLSIPRNERMIAISFEQIMATPKRIMVASGEKKFAAVKAALLGGHITHAILDEILVSLLLD
ncbi:MAG TPA: hypothetical protein DDZ82_13300 [Rhodobacteraceae bacterium]|jgi:deoxyribonucleoside regulator|nr:hypothetical protein [Paracoccaceae bacterium]|tara:strand:+ start:685 stop:1650 length:966 start_codon:yes stop_codon:yes gene_type:complete